ncbi:hypothetical protein BD310DRAFT_918866 [Dichomitus squalens]|uniref:C3H1-type domain-containing protein n=1 Tax=Dichomitus squalens TaxID=114155 RepID=A0A4Q9Q4D4_9APHY|nr:hypothetical protein BD310DRAFT_918866 [Dichomitus squalens]
MNGSRKAERQPDEGTSGSPGQKSRNARYRTKLCRNFPLGTCRYGEHCSYLHIAPTPSPTAQLIAPIHTITRSLLCPTLPMPASSPPSLPSRTPEFPSTAPPRHARPGTGQSTPAQFDIRDGRPRAPRREQPHRRALPRAHTPTVDCSDCPDSQSVRRWRVSVETSADMCTGDADYRLDPPAPPGTPVSAVGAPSSHSLWRDAAGPAIGGLGESYNWPESGVWRDNAQEASEWPPPQVSSTMSRLAQQPAKSARHRNQFFKTKPCRFYVEPGGCIKGDRCNFIHEHPDEGRRPTGLVAPAGTYSESEAEPELSGAESSVQGDTFSPLSPNTGPMSEHAPEHKDSKKNFYPVTWRVVGGGVMMSGQREVCENFMAGRCTEGADCRYAHPDTSEPDYVFPYPEFPPMYSPLSPGPLVSPVIYAYPIMYPPISPPQPFALPEMSGQIPAPPPPPSAAIPESQTPKSRRTHSVRRSLTTTPITQPSGLASGYPTYSSHRIVDGSTLVESAHAPQSYLYPEGGLYAETLFATRSMVRPVSTPPTPIHEHAGIARLFAAESP